VRRIAGTALAVLASGLAVAQSPPPAAGPCATCHGARGLSTAPDAPNLAGQPRIYLAAQLRAFRDGARKHEVMNVIARPLDDAAIAALAEYYAGIAVELREGRSP
jgi:cytochrome c553